MEKLNRRDFLQINALAGGTLLLNQAEKSPLVTVGKALAKNPSVNSFLAAIIERFTRADAIKIIPAVSRDPKDIAVLPRRIFGLHLPGQEEGEYRRLSTLRSLRDIGQVGPNTFGINVIQFQENFASTSINLTRETVKDDKIKFIINVLRSKGYRIMLTPQIHLSNDPAHWHGEIGTGFSEQQWVDWFGSYRKMINRYAELAQQTGVELFVVGAELAATSHRTDDWITTVAGIKDRYRGPLTYGAHYVSELSTMQWWDKLDFIGDNAYNGLTLSPNPTTEELKAAWDNIITKDILPVVQRFGKKLLIPESGCPSAETAALQPWNYRLITDFTKAADVQIQKRYFDALIAAFSPQPWFLGNVWWHWHTDPTVGGLNDKNYTPKDKPVAASMRAYSRSLLRQS